MFDVVIICDAWCRCTLSYDSIIICYVLFKIIKHRVV